MENHTFSEPVAFPEGPIQPCWKIFVFRRGVNEPVACLEVHPQNLPPRVKKVKKQTKVLWKLPDSTDDVPRFGGLEKERLYELFKMEKKNRRKSKKDVVVEAHDNPAVEIAPNEAKMLADAAMLVQKSLSLEDKDEEEDVAPPIVEKGGEPTHSKTQPPEPGDKTNQNNNQEQPQLPPQSQPDRTSPPPPGFGMNQLSLHEEEKRPEENSSAQTSPPPPPGLTAATPPVQQQVQQQPIQPPARQSPPPPPGMAQPAQPPTTATNIPQSAAPPPGLQPTLTSHPPPPTPIQSFSFASLTAAEIETLPHASLSTLVGKHMAHILIHALTTPGQLPIWLSYYHPQAQKLLLFGTAQAVAQTAADRQQQWESLIATSTTVAPNPPGVVGPPPPAAASWDCQGWAVQTLAPEPDTNGQGSRRACSLLVVLTGRTLQRQEVLTYHMTLTLCAVNPRHLPPGTHATHYQIQNEILSLSRNGV